MAKRSITRRLIVSVLLTQLVLTVAVVSLATYLTQRQLRNAFDAALHGRAMSIAALVRFSEEDPPHLIFDATMVPPPLDREHRDFYRILASDGHVIASSPEWSDRLLTSPVVATSHWTTNYQNDTYRLVGIKDMPVLDREGPAITAVPTITVIYAASTEELREQAWRVALLTGLGSLMLLAVSIAVSVWAVREGLSPLKELAASASHVTADNWKLETSQEARSTQELVPLTDAMQAMLVSLEQSFTAQREFLANAAHELKTPIAIAKSTLQLLLQRPRTVEEYRSHLEDALEDVARLESLTHSMLRLARAERTQKMKQGNELPPVDVAMSCEQSIERLRWVADSKCVRLHMDRQSTPKLPADAEDLELIWNNLVENAIRYSPADAAVSVTVAEENHFARVDISDKGPGITEAELPNIFDRFHRADASRSRETGGYGLGLAIVKAMVEAYGGTITVKSRVGSGTTMTVRLPLYS